MSMEARMAKPPPERQCTADSKRRPGEQCEAWAMEGKAVCYHHGGKSLAAADHPQFDHGGYSKYSTVLQGKDLARFEELVQDTGYIELHEEMALLKMFTLDALEGGALGMDLAGKLSSSWRAYTRAKKAGEWDEADNALEDVGGLIGHIGSAAARRQEAKDLMERQRKMAETERRRIGDEETMIQATRVMAFVGVVVAAVREHVTDREQLAAITGKIARAINQDVGTSHGGIGAHSDR